MRSFLGRDILSLKDFERQEFFRVFEVAEKLLKEEFNLSISEGYMDTVGSKDIEVLTFLIERFGLKVDVEKLMQRLMQRYIKLLREKAYPMPGIEVIDDLKKHYRLALASSSFAFACWMNAFQSMLLPFRAS